MKAEADVPLPELPREEGPGWRNWHRPPLFTVTRTKQDGATRYRDGAALLRQASLDVRIAFQPIVSLWSGHCYGFEALLRGHEDLGFAEIHDVFDAAESFGVLHQLDTVICERALKSFVRLPFYKLTRLFLNLDNRTPWTQDYDAGGIGQLMDRWGVDPYKVVLEISERHEISLEHIGDFVDAYRHLGFRLAVDDFGAGYAGLRLLYGCKADFIKIDRFFISEIASDQHKRLFVSRIVELAHTLGIRIIAEGVETVRELLACREIGCDFAQGYFIQRPTEELEALNAVYLQVKDLGINDRRSNATGRSNVTESMVRVEPLTLNAPLAQVLERFCDDRGLGFIPVVNEMNEPQGLVREDDLKELIYSPFGRDLIRNRGFSRTLRDFLTPGRVVDISSDIERMLANYSFNDLPEGIIITDDQKYVGFLTASHLLKLVNEKSLMAAREQNPLTGLPGNHAIDQHVRGLLAGTGEMLILVYFDFDNFKPFNDMYGFRQGDRVIKLFADMLAQAAAEMGAFIGHVGGDDFILIACHNTVEDVHLRVVQLSKKFHSDVVSFYDAEARQRQCIVAMSRDGRVEEYPLLTVSAGVVVVSEPAERPEYEGLIRLLAQAKKEAKKHAKRCVGGVQLLCWAQVQGGYAAPPQAAAALS